MTSSKLWTDGNALAGPVGEVFRVEVSTAIGRCSQCGRTGPMAEVRVFDHWLDLRGLTYLQLPIPDQT